MNASIIPMLLKSWEVETGNSLAPAGSGGPGASGQETPSGDSGTLYRVQVIRQYGAFTSRTNAERLCAKLRAEGIDAVII